MKNLIQIITPVLLLSFGMTNPGYSQQNVVRPPTQPPAPVTPSANPGTSVGFIPGTNSTALGQPNTALGQPSTVLGPPNTAPGQPNNAIGQPNTAIIPSGTTNAVVPSGTTTAIAPLGTPLVTRRQGTGLATSPVTNGFIVNPDGTVIAVPQGGSLGTDLGATNSGTGTFLGTNNIPNP